ncbi:hypothetical protein [Tenacibaculum finnmarkense]|uniref:hypothetical protein n=1 Tax=Tenacibaculum finnmarkense TaxID=2781243 RepID=UPI001E501A62|nr:hypothetical protein [Tenacibaculum finnmarkense]MCD8413608.1 hypothetical protein [Tenacibaculum finnmarkense genomovar ulcerans]
MLELENKQNRLEFISKKMDDLTQEIENLSKIQKTLFDYRAELEKEVFYIMTNIKKGDIVLYKKDKKSNAIEGVFSGLTNRVRGLYSFNLKENDKIVIEDKIIVSNDSFEKFFKTNLRG